MLGNIKPALVSSNVSNQKDTPGRPSFVSGTLCSELGSSCGLLGECEHQWARIFLSETISPSETLRIHMRTLQAHIENNPFFVTT